MKYKKSRDRWCDIIVYREIFDGTTRSSNMRCRCWAGYLVDHFHNDNRKRAVVDNWKQEFQRLGYDGWDGCE